jgi:orotate phosphoribosyltransferase
MADSDFAARTEAILRQANAILEDDHFVSINGWHSSGWIDKDAINPDTRQISALCEMLAEATRAFGAEVVCGPAEGGLIVSLWTGFHSGLPAVFVEHEAAHGSELRGRFIFRRGYDLRIKGKRVVVVDDVVNTGHSIRQTIDAIKQAGGDVVGIGAYIDRGNITAADLGGYPYVYLLQWKIPSWPEDETPAEILARPINTRLAHGADYLARRQGA